MSKNVLFIAISNDNWMGGVYYIKNIIYPLVKNKRIRVFILVNEETQNLFTEYLSCNSIKLINIRQNKLNKKISLIVNKIFKHTIKRQFNLKINKIVKRENIDYIYPIMDYSYLGLENKCVNWIPDFQHIYYPNLFSKKDIKQRNKVYRYIAKNHFKLILSSEAVYQDYKSLYPNLLKNVFVCHFLSNIDSELVRIRGLDINSILNKYNVGENYIIISNQFWKHKNHSTVFKAMKEIKNREIDIQLVCTGNTNDYRNVNYFDELKKIINDNDLNEKINILGVIPREDQLMLMANSNLVIQPSLFEGWNTSVEEAKLLNKLIIISNIDTHIEQKNDKCIVFEKDNYVQLADEIEKNYINNNKGYYINNKALSKIKRRYCEELERVFR